MGQIIFFFPDFFLFFRAARFTYDRTDVQYRVKFVNIKNFSILLGRLLPCQVLGRPEHQHLGRVKRLLRRDNNVRLRDDIKGHKG